MIRSSVTKQRRPASCVRDHNFQVSATNPVLGR